MRTIIPKPEEADMQVLPLVDKEAVNSGAMNLSTINRMVTHHFQPIARNLETLQEDTPEIIVRTSKEETSIRMMKMEYWDFKMNMIVILKAAITLHTEMNVRNNTAMKENLPVMAVQEMIPTAILKTGNRGVISNGITALMSAQIERTGTEGTLNKLLVKI
jgi:hypothetical protein